MKVDVLRRTWPAMWRGLLAGILASLSGCLLFCEFVIGRYSLLGPFGFDHFLTWRYWSQSGPLVLKCATMCMACAAVPSTVGGATIALVIRSLMGGNSTSAIAGVLVGCLTGGLALAASVALAVVLYSIPPVWQNPFWIPNLAVAIVYAIVAGAVVGWRLARFEAGRVTREGER